MSQPEKAPSELTFRAVISGLFVGCLIAASNVAIGLKIGWTFGAAITAAVISFAIFSTFRSKNRPYTAKETLISATSGSSAGTMASAGGFVSAIPALEMIRSANGQDPLSLGMLLLWAAAVAFLGVHFAVPLRRQMVIVEKLKYPTGTATAETIKAMFASGAEALKKTRVLIITGIIAALVKLVYLIEPLGLSGFENLGFEDFGLFAVGILGIPIYQLSVGLNLSPMMLGAGVLVGPKVGWSLLGGAMLAWVIITPTLLSRGVVEVMPDLNQVRAAMNSYENASPDRQAKEERELNRVVDDALVRIHRLAEKRPGMNDTDIVTAYIQSQIIDDWDEHIERLVDAAEVNSLNDEAMPDPTQIRDERLRVGRVLLERLNAAATISELEDWALNVIHVRPVEHLEWEIKAALARNSLEAVRGADKDLSMIVAPYLQVAKRLDLASLTVDATPKLTAIADGLIVTTAQLLSEGKPLLSSAELNVQAKHHSHTISGTLPDTSSPYRAGFNFVLWPGVAMMIMASLVSLAMQWKTIVKTFTSLAGAARGSGKDIAEDDDEEECPHPYPVGAWAIGMTLATILTVVLAWQLFGIPPWMGLIAIVLSLFISAIAVRATGETDINPTGAMGKITQVVYAGIAPANMAVNLMAAAITSAGASQAGDLMHDLKAGYMLKVSIRRQITTQLIGVTVGVFAAAGTYRVLSMVYEIPGPEFPGPAVFAWFKMAEILTVGVSALPPGALWAGLVGAGIGVLLPIISKLWPKVGKWMPSPVAFGIAFMVPAVYSIAMWLGAWITQIVNKRNPDKVERYGASLASGFIAGEGLMMVAFAIYLMLTQVLF
jgi:uncharacterized oligopeptide transporter (OPT) family protein